MKKIIALLLALSLLLCMSATVLAAEGKDGGDEPTATVEAVSETAADSSATEELVPAEAAEPETTDQTDESGETETTAPAGEHETQEADGQPESPALPEENVPTGDSEISQEPTDAVPDRDAQPDAAEEPEEEPAVEESPSLAAPMAMNATYNVSVSWSGLSFTYHEPSKGTWNPATQTYTGAGAGYWTTSDGNGYGTITVKSDQEIDFSNMFDVKIAFKKNEGFTPFLAMRFSETAGNVKTSTKSNGVLKFNTETETQEQKIYLYPFYSESEMNAGVFESAGNNLGTIIITIQAFQGGGDPEYPEQPGIE